MSALIYLSTRSLKNRVFTAFKNPKLVLQILGVLLFVGILIIGAVTGAGFELRIPADLTEIKVLMFVLFIFPYWAGRYSGAGSFGMEDVNLVFTSPIMPSTLLLGGLVRRLDGMLFIVSTVLIVMFFYGTRVEMAFSQFVLAGLFGFILMVVSKLFGIYLFVAYKKVYRWIGFFWCVLLVGVFLFFAYDAGWDFGSGLEALINSRMFELTPLVGWAAAGAYRFMAQDVLWGIFYTGLLVATGGYFFAVIYRSRPDFYEDALEGYHDPGLDFVGAGSSRPEDVESGILRDNADNALTALSSGREDPRASYACWPGGLMLRITSFAGRNPAPTMTKGDDMSASYNGAAAFFFKHMRERKASGWLGVIDKDIFIWVVYAVLWGLYVRLGGIGVEYVAMFFRFLGVPHQSILAVLLPLVFAIALSVGHDSGFKELLSPTFSLLPDTPARKLIWVNMSRVINTAITAVVVFGLAGAISGTSALAVLMGFLAYLACVFMALGLQVASGRLFGVTSRAGKNLAATLSVITCVLAGWIGLMAIFFVWGAPWGMLAGLLAFFAWCMITGGLAFVYAVRGLHDVDVV